MMGAASLALLLAGLLAYELGWSGTADPEASGARDRVAAVVPAVVGAAPVDHTGEWVATILERPLFASGRRPSAPAQAAAAEAAPLGLPRLAGTLISAAGKSAIFAASPGTRPLVLGEGERIGRWTVQSIEAGQVTIAGPDGKLTMRPSFDRTSRPDLPTSNGEASSLVPSFATVAVPTRQER